MKYANICLDSDKGMVNIGDWAQIFAIENLYKFMGINLEDVIKIHVSELSTYEGEYVVLPINYPLFGYYDLSPKIIPVFLGVSMIDNSAVEGLNMSNYQPIGCRDYHTYKEMLRAGLDCYYGGCLTITFNKRSDTEAKRAKKIFAVDLQDGIFEKLPQSIKAKSIVKTHIMYGGGDFRKEAEEKYNEYYYNAALVITSRIHVAQPCLAFGIPVVFIADNMSFRYDLLQKYLRIYKSSEIEEIDWNVSPCDYEKIKRLILLNAQKRVLETYEKYYMTCELSDYFLNCDQRREYTIDSVEAFIRYITEEWDKDRKVKYSVWGITQAAESLYKWISVNYPNAVLDKVIDIKGDKVFHGIKADSIDALQGIESVVFVTAGSAISMAQDMFKKYNVNRFVLSYADKHITK